MFYRISLFDFDNRTNDKLPLPKHRRQRLDVVVVIVVFTFSNALQSVGVRPKGTVKFYRYENKSL